MLMSSMMGAIAFQKGLGAGALHAPTRSAPSADLHHGLANARDDRPSRCVQRRGAARSASPSMAHAVGLDDALAGGLPALAGRPQGRDRHARAAARRPTSAPTTSSGCVDFAIADVLPREQPATRAPATTSCCIFDRGLRRSARMSAARAIGISALLLPRRPGPSGSFQGQDAALRRAVDARTGCMSGGARGRDLVPDDAGPMRTIDLDDYAERPRRPGAARRRRRLRRAPTARSRCSPSGRATRIRDDYEIALLRAFVARRQAGARHLPRPADDQRGASAARSTRTSRRSARARSRAPRRRDSTTATSTRSSSCRARGSPSSTRARRRRHRQQRPPPGGQGPRAGPRRRGALPRGRHRRGDPLARRPATWPACSGTRSSMVGPRATLDDAPLLDDFLRRGATAAAQRDDRP